MLLIIKCLRGISWALFGFALGTFATIVFLVLVWHGICDKLVIDFAAILGYRDASGTYGMLGALLFSILYGGGLGSLLSLIAWLAWLKPSDD